MILNNFLFAEAPGGKGGGAAKGGAQPQNDVIDPSRLDMRVGKVVSVRKVIKEALPSKLDLYSIH